MSRHLALAAAFFLFPVLASAQALATPTASSQTAILAQASLTPLFSSESDAQAHCPKDVVV
jgi:hypothetical protein